MRFIFNDEKQSNSYGFIILTAGIKTTRFEGNPIMLDGHQNSNLSTIGRWLNMVKENGQLSAETEFDPKDANAQSISGKVERGFLKGCSMGISFKKEDLQMINGVLTLTACELLEVSIVAIPSNPAALRLFVDGEELTESDVKALCLSMASAPDNNKNNFKTMTKIQLSQLVMIALGFDGTVTEIAPTDLSTAITVLSADREALALKVKVFEDKEKATKAKLATDLVTNAIKEGRITADKKETFLKLANQDFDLAKSTLDAMAKTTNFSAGVTPGSTGKETLTMEEFQKLSTEEMVAFKQDNPEGYKQLLTLKTT